MQETGQVIEVRSYNTKCGIWTYFTADDGQIDLEQFDYLLIGTLVSYRAMKEYFGADALIPIYIEVEDGERLERALAREKKQAVPKYAEMCRRFLADAGDCADVFWQTPGTFLRRICRVPVLPAGLKTETFRNVYRIFKNILGYNFT